MAVIHVRLEWSQYILGLGIDLVNENLTVRNVPYRVANNCVGDV